MIPLELTQPWWLAGFLVLPVLGYYFYRSLADFPYWQKVVSLCVRATVVTLLVLSLAGLTLLRPTSEQYVIFAVDQSTSVGDDALKAADKFLDESLPKAGRNKVAYVPFATQSGNVRTTRVKAGPSPKPASPADKTPVPELDEKGTNLAAVIEAAAGAMPPAFVPQVVILSDGNQTHGDALKAALRAGIPISTLPLPSRKEPEAQVSSVQAPAQVREGEPFYVDVVVDSNHDDEATVEVFRGDHKVANEKKTLKKGENRFRFQQSIQRERLAQFTARISGLKQDTLLDNNAESGLVFTAGKPRVLIIESDPKLIRDLVSALEQEEIQVDVRPVQGMPESLADLQNYELLCLSNVPATALTQRQMEIARTYVQDLGGGLMMLGGEQSFGLGGYYKSVLEEILPVRSDFEKEKEKPSLAMVLVIDKSGSMDGDKIEMAKSAARSAVELLGNNDKVGIVAFDGETYVISEITQASNKAKVSDEISRIEASGGTTMAPAMEQAFEMLTATAAKLKHVIILTDGVSSPGDFQGIAQQMMQAKITCSTVAVGSDSDTDLLQDISKTGNGRYYLTEDPAQVPQIFAKETVTASKSAIDEQPFVPQVIRATKTLQGIEFDSAPFLLGYVMTRPKPTSELVLATEKGDPLLAWWRYGLGMTVAFTSDAKARWAAEWLTWPGYGKFWAQVVRHAMRKSETKGIVVQTEQKAGQATLTVDAIDATGRFLNQAETEVTVIDPHLGNKKLALQQTAPGRYVVSFPTTDAGAYHLEITQKQNGQVLYRQSRGLSVGYSDELRLKPTNDTLLKQIAEVTGGKYQPTPADVFAPTTRTANRPEPLWPWLVSIAAVLFVFDVALRRIDLSAVSWTGRKQAEAAAGFSVSRRQPTPAPASSNR